MKPGPANLDAEKEGADMRLSFSPGKVSDDAQRLMSCIIGADDPTGNLAHEAVSAVEMHLLQRGWPVGEALGGLPEVQKDLGLGRPACREAMIILEARGLLDVRRGPGGGLFVAAPTAEDVVGAMLMYLTISGASAEVHSGIPAAGVAHGCRSRHRAQRRRPRHWRQRRRMGFRRRSCSADRQPGHGHWRPRSPKCWSGPAKGVPAPGARCASRARLEGARHDGGRSPGWKIWPTRMDLAAPLLALESMERSFAWSGRKSAMALAARMTREMIHRPEKLEAEWETADRLGYSDAVVRQARRILQDFGVVRCQRGRKGALWGAPASPAGVIRLLAPCLIASGMTARDNAETANFLACNGPRLAAGRSRRAWPRPDQSAGRLRQQCWNSSI